VQLREIKGAPAMLKFVNILHGRAVLIKEIEKAGAEIRGSGFNVYKVFIENTGINIPECVITPFPELLQFLRYQQPESLFQFFFEQIRVETHFL
jgi:hypothetical protein